MVQTVEKVAFSWPVRYSGNIFLLVLFLCIRAPFGVMLMCKNCYVLKNGSRMSFRYHGSWFWLFVWAFLFSPIAFLLLLINGVDVVSEDKVRFPDYE